MFDNYKINTELCVKCGKCIPDCTIHKINSDEVTSPRGFIELLGAYQDGDLELDKDVKDIFESCFLCTSCVQVCPNSIPTDMLIEQVRDEIRKKFGLAWYKKAFFFLLRHRKIMDFMAKMGYVFQTCGFKIIEEKNSMKPRFSLPIIKKDRMLPSVGEKTFLNANPPKIDNGGKIKVAIFIGCLANYSYTNIGKSLLEILAKLEIDVDLIKEQKCCGAPAYFTGDFDTVRHLAQHNITYFESFIDEVDAIIIPEATCSAMIKIDYPHFFDKDEKDKEWKNRAIALQNKIFMATEYLAKNTKLKKLLSSYNQNLDNLVTYHDPCHAKKMQGIFREPRELLSQNYQLTEMSDPDRCCGFGGVTMQSEKYHLAKKAGMPKASMIEQTKANLVSTECSACKMQITNSLNVSGIEDVIVKNPIELIADALKK